MKTSLDGTAECTSLPYDVKVSLIRQALTANGSFRAEAVSSSMSPLIYRGDEVEYEKVEIEYLIPGDIVVVEGDNALITHRFIGLEANRLLLKGDANKLADEPFDLDKLIARAHVIHRRSGRTINLDSKAQKIASRILSVLSKNAGICEVKARRQSSSVMALFARILRIALRLGLLSVNVCCFGLWRIARKKSLA